MRQALELFFRRAQTHFQTPTCCLQDQKDEVEKVPGVESGHVGTYLLEL